jgi:hypothetical protein
MNAAILLQFWTANELSGNFEGFREVIISFYVPIGTLQEIC